jgi:hypothetical protein
MYKYIKLIFSAGLLILGVSACHPGSTQETKETTADTSLLQAPYAGVYYDSLAQALDTYYDLTDGLTMANMPEADRRAAQLKGHIDSLPFATLQMDSSRLAKLKANGADISAELTGLLGEKTIDQKRLAFGMVSDMLFDMVKVTGIKGKTIYRHYCPMAFDDRGAYWLSRNRKLQNPYFGNDMTSCVQVTDSLRYQ